MKIAITDKSYSHRHMMSSSKEDAVLIDSEIEDNEKLLFFLSLSKGDNIITGSEQFKIANKTFDFNNNKILVDVVK